jgi:hypothetical protein
MSRASELSEDELRALRLGGGPWLLVECPLVSNASFDLRWPNSRPVAPDRPRPPRALPPFQRDPEQLRSSCRTGCCRRSPPRSLVGYFERTVKAFSETLMRTGLVDNVASDARRRAAARARDHAGARGGRVRRAGRLAVARGAARGAQRLADPAATRARGSRRAGRCSASSASARSPGARPTRPTPTCPTCSSRRSPTLGTGAAMRTYTATGAGEPRAGRRAVRALRRAAARPEIAAIDGLTLHEVVTSRGARRGAAFARALATGVRAASRAACRPSSPTRLSS